MHQQSRTQVHLAHRVTSSMDFTSLFGCGYCIAWSITLGVWEVKYANRKRVGRCYCRACAPLSSLQSRPLNFDTISYGVNCVDDLHGNEHRSHESAIFVHGQVDLMFAWLINNMNSEINWKGYWKCSHIKKSQVAMEIGMIVIIWKHGQGRLEINISMLINVLHYS